MLREITAIRPDPGHASKQWFTDDAMDLFVWRNSAGDIQKFQLACKEGVDEHALTWTGAGGITFHVVDDGERRTGRHKATPILLPARPVPLEKTTRSFLRRAEQLDPALRDFIQSRLEEATQRSA